MAGYARTNTADITASAVVKSAPINAELNAVVTAFAFSGGHNHDGSSTEGAYVGLIADTDALNKVVVDTSNNRVGFFAEVSSSAVEQVRIQDGAILPVTDNDIDLGASGTEFKDLFIDGTAHIDTLDVDANATIAGTLDVTGAMGLSGAISFADGSASAPSITNTGDTNCGLFFSAADTLSFTAGGTAQFTMADGAIAPVTDNDVDLGTSSLEFKDGYFDGTVHTDAINLNGTAITSTAAELNILDGVTSTAAELNILDGVTSTAAELNVLDGITAVVGELNALDLGSTAVGNAIASKAVILDSNKDYTGLRNVTATGAITAGSFVIGDADINENDLESIDGITAGTVSASKAAVVDTNKDITGFRNVTLTGELDAGSLDISGDADIDGTLETDALSINGTAVTSTAAELNVLDGVTAVVGELNALDLGSTAVGTAIASKAVVLDSNKDYTGIRNFTITGNLTVGGTQTVVDTVTMNAANAIVFEGATADDHETTLTITDPTADRTIKLPNQSGTLPVLAADSDTAITSTPAELNLLDGVTATTAELNILDGVTSTAAELNILDGVTSTAAELNILDGVTSTTAELNTLDGITAVVGELNALDLGSTAVGTAIASKAVILDSDKDYTGIRNLTTTGTVQYGSLSDGTITITAFVDEDNMASNSATLVPTQQSVKAYVDSVSGTANNVTGLTATGTELNVLDGASAGTIVNSKGVIYSSGGKVNATSLQIAGTDLTATAAEFNLLDGGSTVGTTTVASGDGLLTNDGGTMRQTNIDTFDTYLSATTKTLTNKTLTSPVLTSPKFADGGFIADANGNELIMLQTASSAVNQLEVTNAASGSSVVVGASGDDSNIDIDISPKGTGEVNIAAGNLNYAGTAITATGAELNLTDGSSGGTIVNSKAVIYGSSGEVNATTLQIAGTAITSTAAELNIVDGNTSATGGTLVDADRIVVNDNGTMVQETLSTLKTYLTPLIQEEATALAIALG